MNTTVRIKASEIYKDWHVIDAAGKPLGRVATEAAVLLRGKHKPTYEPHLDDGDFVIIVNASQVRVTGRKSEQIKYYTHSGYPGGLKTRTYVEQMEKHSDRVIEKAVWGMLPGGSLGEKMLKHLKVYKGPKHPHQSQIAGSENARSARAALAADASLEPRKPARLRPLPVPQIAAGADDQLEPVATAAPVTSVKPVAAAPVAAPAEEATPTPVAEVAPAADEATPDAETAAAGDEATTKPARRRRATTEE